MSSAPLAIPTGLEPAVAMLVADLRAIFGTRLGPVLAYGSRIHQSSTLAASRTAPLNTMALVDALSFHDLSACAARADGWDRAGLAMPLLLGRTEFERSLDVFPVEYGDIIAEHVVVAGPDPFEGVMVSREDLRRACESQAKSHLLHLRGGFLEARGQPAQVANLILASAAPLFVLLGSLARLTGSGGETPEAVSGEVDRVPGISGGPLRDVLALVRRPLLPNDEAMRLYPGYLAAVEQVVAWVDGWQE